MSAEQEQFLRGKIETMSLEDPERYHMLDEYSRVIGRLTGEHNITFMDTESFRLMLSYARILSNQTIVDAASTAGVKTTAYQTTESVSSHYPKTNQMHVYSAYMGMEAFELAKTVLKTEQERQKVREALGFDIHQNLRTLWSVKKDGHSVLRPHYYIGDFRTLNQERIVNTEGLPFIEAKLDFKGGDPKATNPLIDSYITLPYRNFLGAHASHSATTMS